MSKNVLLFVGLMGAALLSVAEVDSAAKAEPPAMDRAARLRMEQQLDQIRDPAVKLFFRAGLERAQGHSEAALKTLSGLILEHSHRAEWVAKGELMGVELYMDLGMLEAADVTAEHVEYIYADSDYAAAATALRTKIKQSMEQAQAAAESE